MNRTILFLLTITILGLPLQAQDAKAVADRIRLKTDVYEWAEGAGDTEREAKAEAVRNLAHQFTLIFTGISSESYERKNDDEKLQEQNNSVMASTIRFNNLETLLWEEVVNAGKSDEHIRYKAFCYVNREEVKAANEARLERVREMVEAGIEQEKQLAVGSALRYYNWAYTMLMRYGDKLKIDVDGSQKEATVWLPAKIESVLNNITFDFDESEIISTPEEYDKHTLMMTVRYGKQPVQSLDFSFFNGERNLSVHAKNGKAMMRFVDLSELQNIDIKVEHTYTDQAAKSFDEELKVAMAGGAAYNNAVASRYKLPVKVKKERVAIDRKKAEAEARLKANNASLAAVQQAPIVGETRKQVVRPVVDDTAAIEAMTAVENALRTKNYESVKNLFTADGYDSFRRITNRAKLTVATKEGKPLDLKVETTSLFKYGSGIPVIVRNGNHMSNERLVFRFDIGSGLIKSVAYALTDKAESDIFRQAQWDMNSRYSLLTFMEDYQTAFCTKNIDFIERLFSDDAIIIVGKAVDNKSSRRGMFDGMQISGANTAKKRKFNMSRYTKGEYIKNLRSVFGNNSWIQVSYEENEISKVYTGGIIDSEVLWIEIRQNWESSSGYNDTGYLGLQINMKPAGSQINVRTFTPEFIPMDSLKKSFPVAVKIQN